MYTIIDHLVHNRKALEAEIERIGAIDFATFINDVDMLTVCIYASHPSLHRHYLRLPSTDIRRVAAERADHLHSHLDDIQKLARKGYFCKQLRQLLSLAKSNSDYGAKLVQVFCCMLEHRCEHHLDRLLVKNLEAYLLAKGRTDGFLLREQPDGCYRETFFV